MNQGKLFGADPYAELKEQYPKLFVDHNGMLKIGILSLWQPWASAIVTEHPKFPGTGIKEYETRGWQIPPHYIGKRILIHAALKKDSENMSVWHRYPFTEYDQLSAPALSFGALIGTVELVKCITTEEFKKTNFTDRFPEEFHMGNYDDGRFAWQLRDPHLLPSNVVPYRGFQKMWQVAMDDLPKETSEFIFNILANGSSNQD